MPKAYLQDDEFIELWRKLRSATAFAKATNMGVRAIFRRREIIEKRHKIKLEANTSQQSRIEARKIDHKGRVELDITDGIVIVFSDAHYWPGLISTAHKALIKFIRHLKPVAVIANGDIFDGGAISRFPRIGWDNKPTVIEELKTVDDRLTEIENVCGNARLIWTLGNHDARYETFLASRVPEFQGVDGFTLKARYPKWMPAWSCWINNDTVIKHRWKGGIHATHNNTVNSGVNIITGHLHSLKVTAFSDYNGNRFGVDTGTLATPYGPQFIDYTEDNPNNWRSGFAVLTFKEGKLLWPEVVHVISEDDGEYEFRGATDIVE